MKSPFLSIIVSMSIQINFCFAQDFTTYLPKYNQVLIEQNPTFEWNKIAGCSNYIIEISDSSNFSNLVISENVATNSYTPSLSLDFFEWFWRVKAVLGSDTLISNSSVFSVFKPNILPDNILWLNAGEGIELDGDGRVATWNDLSPNEFSFNQDVTIERPTLTTNGINNTPFLNFTGNQSLSGGDILDLNTNNRSFLFVASPEPNNSTSQSSTFMAKAKACACPNRFAFLYYNNQTVLISQEINENHIFSMGQGTGFNTFKITQSRETQKNTIFLNNIEIGNNFLANANYNFNSSYRFLIGAYNNQNDDGELSYYKGGISEIIGVNSIDSVSIEKVEHYLSEKYSKTMVNLGPDTTFIGDLCEKTISAPSGYESYLWSTGSTTQSTIVTEPGNYWVRAVDNFGRVSYDTIHIHRPIMDSISLENFSFCFDSTIVLNPFIPEGSFSFVQWSDGNTDNPRIINDNISLSYSVVDENNCFYSSNSANYLLDTTLNQISLGEDTVLCSGNNIGLTISSDNIIDYFWNTGNTNNTQVVDTTGEYIIKVINSFNCENFDTIQVTVIGVAPNLQFSFPNLSCEFDDITFNDSSFVPNGDGTISNKIWTIGSNLVLNGNNGSFSLDSAGIYPVTITVETMEGCNSSETFNLVVNPKPIVSFETQNFCPYDEIQFIAANATGEQIDGYNWDFDHNSQTSNLEAPSYTFGESNIYNVELMVEDVNGCRDTTVQEVYIQPAPVAEISIANPCESAPIEITNNSSIADTFSIATYSWNYGDNTSAINPIEEKVYDTYGEYEVEVILTANNGCQDTSTQQITVHPEPILNWQLGPACKNSWTIFENASSIPLGSIEQTNWLVNLQYPLEGESAAYQFVTTGIQYVTLTSISDQACQKDTLILIDVQPELNSSFNINPINAIAGTPVIFTPIEQNAVSYEWSFGNGESTTSSSSSSVENVYSEDDIGSVVETFLIVENEIGCVDTSFKYLTINETRVDLSIENMFVQDVNGYLSIGVELKNDGLIDISKIDLFLNVLNGVPILESENSGLQAGESKIYIFNASPSSAISSQDDNQTFVCVDAISYNNYNLQESNLSNNRYCKNIENTGYTVLPINPNPTSQDILIEFILEKDSFFSVTVVDEKGSIVQQIEKEFSSGLNFLNLHFASFSSGLYYIHFTDGHQVYSSKVIKK